MLLLALCWRISHAKDALYNDGYATLLVWFSERRKKSTPHLQATSCFVVVVVVVGVVAILVVGVETAATSPSFSMS